MITQQFSIVYNPSPPGLHARSMEVPRTTLFSPSVAGPGQGFYIVFCIAVHLSTLLFAALTSVLPPSPAEAKKQEKNDSPLCKIGNGNSDS